MLKDIVAVQPLEPYRLMLRFEDGAEGVIDLQQLVSFSGVFAALSNPEEFASVQVHPELGTVYWPCGADLDPDVLYAHVTGQPIRNYQTPVES